MSVETAKRSALKDIGLFAIPLAFFARVVFTNQVFVARDLQRVYLPLKSWWAMRVGHGEMPLWYPLDGLGQPFIGMVVSGAWSPFNLLHLVMSDVQAVKWSLIAAYLLAFGGAVHLGRQLRFSTAACVCAATIFSLTGYLVSLSNNPTYATAACTIPWSVSFAYGWVHGQRRWFLLGGAFATATIALCGDAMNFAVALAVLLLVATPWSRDDRWPRVGRAVALCVAAVGLASCQMLPALAIRGASISADQSVARALTWSGHPIRLLEWLFGPVFLNGDHQLDGVGTAIDASMNSAWSESQHIGGLGIVLAILGAIRLLAVPRARPFVAAWCVLFIVWLGRFTPAGEWAYRFVPLWKSFRYPEKLTPWLLLGLAIAAGTLVAQTIDLAKVRKQLLIAAGVGVAALLLELATGTISRLVSGLPPASAEAVHRHLLVGAGVVALCSGIAAFLPAERREWLIAALVVLPIGVSGFNTYWVGPGESLTQAPAVVEILKERSTGPAPTRVWSTVGSAIAPDDLGTLGYGEFMAEATKASLRPATGSQWGIATVDGYLPAMSLRVREAGVTEATAALWGTDFVVSTTDKQPAAAERVATVEDVDLSLSRLTHRLQRVFVARERTVHSPTEAKAALTDAAVIAGTEVVIESAVAGDAPADATGTATIRDFQPERITIDVTATAAAVVVLNEAFYPGWTAELDGTQVEILAANAAVRGVRITGGAHVLAMRYASSAWLWGTSLTLATGAFLLLWCAAGRRSRGALLG